MKEQNVLNVISLPVAANVLGYNIDFVIEICRHAHVSGRPFTVIRSTNGLYFIEKTSFERYINTCPDYYYDEQHFDPHQLQLSDDNLDFVCGTKQDANAAGAERYEESNEVTFSDDELALLNDNENEYINLATARYMLGTDIPNLIYVCQRAYYSARPFKVTILYNRCFAIEKSSLLRYMNTRSVEMDCFFDVVESEATLFDHVCGCKDFCDEDIDDDACLMEDTYENEPILFPEEYYQMRKEDELKNEQEDADAKLFAQFRALRIALGMTQGELAAKAGMGQTDLSKLERGLIKNPAYETLKKVANALGFVLRTNMV